MITLLYENKELPLYEQIYLAIKKEIQGGTLREKQKLPSKRNLAKELGVSVNTVDFAYSQLSSEGYIETVPKSGCYVKKIDRLQHIELESKPLALEHKGLGYEVDFSPSDVDKEHFPYCAWRKILKQSFDEMDDDILKSPPLQGDFALREAIAEYLRQSRSIECDSEQIIIGTGTSSLLRCICGIMEKDRIIATENPVYNDAYRIFQGMGRQCVPIYTANDEDVVKDLENSRAGAFYVTPSHQFPLGFSMPVSTRMSLLNWAGKGRYIIEDDYDSEFRYTGRPLPPIKSMDKYGKVVYIGTFSKCIAPSLKISYALLPSELFKKYQKSGGVYISASSRLEQKVLCAFIKEGHFERHINKMRNLYGKKRNLLVSLLSKYKDIEIKGENAGHHILIGLKGLSEQKMITLAEKSGVKVYPVSDYFIGDIKNRYKSCVLLGYGALGMSDIEKGVENLARAWGIGY